MLFNKKNSSRPRQSKRRLTNQPSVTFYRSGNSEKETTTPKKNLLTGTKMSNSFIRGVGFIGLVALLAGLGHNLSLKPEPVVDVSDASYRDSAEYEAAAAKKLQSFKNRNKITIDETEITDHLTKTFSEIVGARITHPFIGRKIQLSVFIAKPALILKSGGQSYIVSEKGSTAGSAADFPHLNKLPLLVDESNFIVGGNKQVMTEDAIRFITVVRKQLINKSLSIDSMVMPPLPHELHLKLDGYSYVIKLHLQGDALEQAGKILASHNRFQTTNQHPTDYLDVRVEGKVFFK